MRTLLSSALIVGLLSLPTISLVGCSDEAKQETKEIDKTPGGKTETTVTKEIKSSGDNPPPNSSGEKVEKP